MTPEQIFQCHAVSQPQAKMKRTHLKKVQKMHLKFFLIIIIFKLIQTMIFAFVFVAFVDEH